MPDIIQLRSKAEATPDYIAGLEDAAKIVNAHREKHMRVATSLPDNHPDVEQALNCTAVLGQAASALKLVIGQLK